VCRLVPKKGVDLSIRAVAVARSMGIDVHLTLVGEGTERQSLEALRAALGVEREVTFLGARPYPELPALFRNADALIQPSRTGPDGDSEGGHPTVVLEAQAQGLPVVGTTHADIPFVVRHGVTGLLVPEEDFNGLAAAVNTLSKLDRTRMGRLARARALRRHGLEKVQRLQERAYRRAVAER
jgi:glycosyltransferase involved in cell wall biosynthesis